MTKLLIASNNPGKVIEFRELLAGCGWEIVAPTDIGIDLDVEETGVTYAENARIKAQAFCAASGLASLADDSGLEVDALGGAPGVISARYAGEHATDAANNALLLENLRGVENRTARFVCVIALVQDGKLVKSFRGTVEGRVIDEARGDGGFGYDPLFYCPAFGCTFGEATIEQKMQVSHRGRALEAMFTYLRSIAST